MGPAMSTPGLLCLSLAFAYNSYWRLKTRNRCEHVKYVGENNKILSLIRRYAAKLLLNAQYSMLLWFQTRIEKNHMYYGRCSDSKELPGSYSLNYFDINAILISGVPRGIFRGFNAPPPKF